MSVIFSEAGKRQYSDHPRFEGVKIAVLVKESDTEKVSVSELIISPGVEAPVHTHDLQADSIYVVSGQGEAFLDGTRQKVAAGDYIFVPAGAEHGISNTGPENLQLFVHHSPPLF